MKKNQTGEAQCCWKAHTSVSWSACQPSAHEVLGLIRLMHLLMGLTRMFNESVISFTCFNILTGTTLHKAGRGPVGVSSSSSRGRGHQKHWKESITNIAFPWLWDWYIHHHPHSCYWDHLENHSLRNNFMPQATNLRLLCASLKHLGV